MATANMALKSNVFGMARSIRGCAASVAANDSGAERAKTVGVMRQQKSAKRQNAVLFLAPDRHVKFEECGK